jgi:lysophospholipase L1-like esterase
MSKPTRNRRSGWLRRALLMTGSLVLSFLLLEAGLWMIGFEFPVTTARHPHRGYSNRPNAAWVQRSEGFATVSTNSRGFRDAEWEIEKPADTVRIAVLGDSFTEATQVAEEERFTELVEKQLGEQGLFGGRKIEVMNFGTSGYGTAQQLMTWRHDVKPYQPDFVVLAFLSGNDIRNNSEKLEGDPIRPYFVQQNGQLVLDDSFREERLPLARSVGLKAASYSRVAQVVYQVSRGLRAKRKLEQIEKSSAAEAKVVELGLADPGLSTWIYSHPKNKEHKTAWQITEELISQLDREVAQSGGQLFVVSLTNAIQVHPSEESRKQFAKLLQINDVLYPDQRITRHCRQNGIAVLSLVPGMQAHAQKHHRFLHGFENTTLGHGHWNAAGHLVAGSLIVDWLEQELAGAASEIQSVSHEE